MLRRRRGSLRVLPRLPSLLVTSRVCGKSSFTALVLLFTVPSAQWSTLRVQIKRNGMRAEAFSIHLWAHNSSEQQHSAAISPFAGSRKTPHKPAQNEEIEEKITTRKAAPEYQSNLRMAETVKKNEPWNAGNATTPSVLFSELPPVVASHMAESGCL